MEAKKYYTSGEFAKHTGVNKRTLHYYNEIGLFKPAFIGENGYHYYSDMQFASLELILVLRRIGLSIGEIQAYFFGSAHDGFEEILAQKKQLIEDSIAQLLSIRSFLDKRSERIQLALQAKHGEISCITLPARRIVLSEPIIGMGETEEIAIAAEFSMRLKKLFSLYDNFGTRISVDALQQHQFDCYDRYYAYCPKQVTSCDEIIPAGTYLQAFCIGNWDKLSAVYAQILQYAQENSLVLSGYAYEEGLNEMALNMGVENISYSDDYVTRIIVEVKKKQ